MDKFRIYHPKKSFTETQNRNPGELLLVTYDLYTYMFV